MNLKVIDFKICESESVGTQIYDFIRRRIIFADLLPGTHISEAEIAKKYLLSRQPVREAFIKLKEENLVLIRPQRGTLVKKISVKLVMDARFVREAVEADIVKILAEKGDRSLIKTLKEQLEAQRKVDDQDAAGFLRLDELFHRTLADGANKAKVWTFLETIKTHMDRARFLNTCQSDHKQLIIQHSKVIDAIEKKDSNLAEKEMRNHLQKILLDLPETEKINPEFFEQ